MRATNATPFVLFGAILLLYVLTPTQDYYGDGITYAFNIEHVYRTGRNLPRLIHQNHLLFSLMGYWAYGLVARFSPAARALTVLQDISALFGALGVTAFYCLACDYLRSARSALVCAVGLGVLAGWWRTSTDADVYAVGASLLICAVAMAARWPNVWPTTATILATAMLIHQLSVFGLPAVAFVIYVRTHGGRRHRACRAALLCLTAASITVGVYAFVAIAFGRVSELSEVLGWSISNQGGFEIMPDPFGNAVPAVLSNIRLVFAHNVSLFKVTAGFGDHAALALSAMFLGLAISTASHLAAKHRQAKWVGLPSKNALGLCVIWILPYLAFLLVWEPYLTYYRVFYAPAALLLAVALGESVVVRGWRHQQRVFAWSVVGCLAFANFALYVRPNMNVRANTLVFQARSARTILREGDVVLVCEPTEADIAALYFNPQVRSKQVRTAGLSVDDLCLQIKREGHRVWLNSCAASHSALLREHSASIGIEISNERHSAKFVEALAADGT